MDFCPLQHPHYFLLMLLTTALYKTLKCMTVNTHTQNKIKGIYMKVSQENFWFSFWFVTYTIWLHWYEEACSGTSGVNWRAKLLNSRRLQGSDFNIIFSMFGTFTDWGRVRSVCYKWISWSFIIISNSNMITTLAAKKCCSPMEQTPGVFWKEGNALEFINLSKSALINEDEWDDPSLDGFPIFRANRRGVPIGGAQVQFIPANTAAAPKFI